MEKADQAVADILNKLGMMASKYGPEAIELMAQGVAIRGIQTLVIGVGCAFVAFFAWKFVFHFYNKIPEHRTHDMPEYPAFWGTLFSVFVALGTSICAIINICTVSSWYALFNPKVYVAYLIVEKVLGSK